MTEYIDKQQLLNKLRDTPFEASTDLPVEACRGANIARNTIATAILLFPAADVVEEENVLKFYYVRSIDEYWIGRRIDNFYYAEYDPKSHQWVWTHSRYLPWGKHVIAPDTLWKEHTYPSEPEEIPFDEWLLGFIKKHLAAEAALKERENDG